MPNNNTEEMRPLPQTSAVKQSGDTTFHPVGIAFIPCFVSEPL